MVAIHKLRVWGWAGVRDFVTKRISWWRYARQLERLARLDADAKPIRGITIIGDFCGGSSNSKTNRDFVRALREAGIPFQTFAVDRERTIPAADYADLITPIGEFRLHRYTHVIEMFRSPLPRHLVPNRARIAFWEGEHGMFEVWPFLRGKDPLIAMSDFNASYFRTNPDGAQVHKILYPLRQIDVKLPCVNEVRRRFGLNDDDFVVFFNFDFGSYYRKNPGAAIRAFSAALRDRPEARLLFKVQSAKHHPLQLAELKALARSEGVADKLIVVTEYLPHDWLYALTAACDIYLSLHRGEGFGIGMAEAMLFGKPVIATDWSANTEYCRPETSFPIPCRMIPIRPDEYFEAMREWAEADVGEAAKALRQLYEDPVCRHRIGAAGRAFVTDHFSLSNFKASVEEFLDNSPSVHP